MLRIYLGYSMTYVFIAPGNKQSLQTNGFKELVSIFRKAGYKTVFVPIKWKHANIHHWVKQYLDTVKKTKAKNFVFFGFSYGAMIALVAATKLKPQKLYLASLSPYFSEDIDSIPERWRQFIGKKRVKAFREVKLNELAKSVRSKTILFMGEKEAKRYPQLKKRVEDTRRKIKRSKLFWIKDSEHDISNKNYLETVAKNI